MQYRNVPAYRFTGRTEADAVHNLLEPEKMLRGGNQMATRRCRRDDHALVALYPNWHTGRHFGAAENRAAYDFMAGTLHPRRQDRDGARSTAGDVRQQAGRTGLIPLDNIVGSTMRAALPIRRHGEPAAARTAATAICAAKTFEMAARPGRRAGRRAVIDEDPEDLKFTAMSARLTTTNGMIMVTCRPCWPDAGACRHSRKRSPAPPGVRQSTTGGRSRSGGHIPDDSNRA